MAKSISTVFKKVVRSHGDTKLGPGGKEIIKPWELDAAKKAIQELSDINGTYGTDDNTILHEVVRLASLKHQYSNVDVWRPRGELQRQRNFSLKLVKFILKRDPSINLTNKHGETVLHYAASGHPKILEELLKHNPDLNIGDKYGCTPLINTCNCKYPQAKNVELLLDAGADANASIFIPDDLARDENLSTITNGWTALDFLNKSKYPKVTKLLKQYKGKSALKPIKKSKNPIQDAKKGNLETLLAMADDGDGDLDAYKWLCVAEDFGHKKAADMANDLLESSSLKFDDENWEKGYAHWDLGLGYLEGNNELPHNIPLAKKHLRIAQAFIPDHVQVIDKTGKIMARLDTEAKNIFQEVLGL